MSEPNIAKQAEQVIGFCRGAGLKLATAESCTGGLVAAYLTAIPGASQVVECGFVTYSNDAKINLLGVGRDTLETHGAVSEQVARAMAEGALERSNADIAVSITGIAGPGGGRPDRPVGLVHFACARRRDETEHRRMEFGAGSRRQIRLLSVQTAFRLIMRQAERPSLA
ncbi:MAG: CinA family protein [Hyphomicrobiales bacterium]